MFKRKMALAALMVAVMPVLARAHFVFVLPSADGKSAQVLMSETLKPDSDVGVEIIQGLKLSIRGADGKDAAVGALVKGEHDFKVDIGASKDATRIVHGEVDLGVSDRGGKTFVLVYHPKAIVGDAFEGKTTLGSTVTPVEIFPTRAGSGMKLTVMAGGKLAPADTEVVVLIPNGEEKRVKTDGAGLTPEFTEAGRYGAWTRYFENAPGERDGKKYEQVRHYGTLVFDLPGKGGSAVGAVPAAAKEKVASSALAAATKLPEATSSFGAVECGGWLYVYGGHIAPTHEYSTETASGKFSRLNLADGKTWEELPSGPKLQGMNLVSYGGKVYRVGGMQSLNKPGDDTDNHSVGDVAVFDPSSKTWGALPALPTPRSSHDVAMVGDKLIVLGGWSMHGKDGNDWLGETMVMDLKSSSPAWQAVKQSFERRALIAASHEGKVYVLGGFDEESEPSNKVDIFDPANGTWAAGPAFPGGGHSGFAPAACSFGGKLYLSTGDGNLHWLDETKNAWVKITNTTPRIVHRMVGYQGKLYIIGGASRGGNMDLIEVVDLATLK